MPLKRRSFLALLGSSTLLPVLPGIAGRRALGARAAAGYAGYNKLLYGLAVHHAEVAGSATATGLAARLGVTRARARGLMRQMMDRGVLVPTRPAAPILTDQHAPRAQETTMDKFETLTGIAAPMPLVNIDTDMIIPKVFLKTIKRSGLGVNLFDEMRYDRQGNEIPDFVLNKDAYREAEIIVAGDNFGCGSSREHAPWALKDFGIRSVISTSFADIFYNNCFKNGILPIVLPQEAVDVLMKDAEKGANARMTVDLEAQTVTSSDGDVFSFEVDAFKKHCLINGLDDIGLTMEKAASIDSFEARAGAERPWV